MTEYTHLFHVNKGVTLCQLLDRVFIVSQRIIPLVAVPVSMVIFPPHRRSTPVSHGYHDKAHLSQTGIHVIIHSETGLHVLEERSRVNRRNNRIGFRGIEIRRFPHHTVNIRYPVCRLHLKPFGFLPTECIKVLQVRFLQLQNHFAFPIAYHVDRFHIHPGIAIHEILARRRDIHVMRGIFRG